MIFESFCFDASCGEKMHGETAASLGNCGSSESVRTPRKNVAAGASLGNNVDPWIPGAWKDVAHRMALSRPEEWVAAKNCPAAAAIPLATARERPQ